MKSLGGVLILFILSVSFANPAVTEPNSKPQAVVESGSKTESADESKHDSHAESKAESKTDSKTESKNDSKVDSKTEAKGEAHGTSLVAFPQVLSWRNNPDIELDQKKKIELKKDILLKHSFVIVTGPQDEVVIKFHGGEKIMVMPQSKVLVPQVSPDSGEVSEVFLVEGTVRFTTGADMNRASKLRMKSPFFDLSLPAELDVFMTVDSRQPSAKFQVVKGEMTAAFLDFEKTHTLKAGDAVTFSGEKDGDTIKYDVLLNSRKSPRGVLHEVEKFDYQGYLAQEKAKNEAHKKALEKENKEKALKLKKQKDFKNSFLCQKPYGQRDQCYWKVQGDKCFRYRCNVSGKWGDETERPMTDVCTQNKAQTCDY